MTRVTDTPTMRAVVEYFRSGPAPTYANGFGFRRIADIREDLSSPSDLDRALESLWRAGRLAIECNRAQAFDRRSVRLVR